MTAAREKWGRWDGSGALSSLLEFVPPAPPPADLLDRIENRIDAIDRARSAADAHAARVRSGWRMLGAGLAGVLAGGAVMAAVVLSDPGAIRRCGGSVPLAVLASADEAPRLRVAAIADGRYLRLEHSGPRIAADRALELWAIAKGDPVPRSLGLLAAKGKVTVLPLTAAIDAGDVLALSEEPAGGSPAAAPTGPVLVSAIADPSC